MGQQQRQQWLEQSILRRLVAPVKNIVEEIASTSTFLQTPAPQVALFARHELVLNEIPLGTGGFSTVHEIIAVNVDDSIHRQCDPSTKQLRLDFSESLLDDNGTPRYVMKHLMRKLLNRPKDYQCALRDLVLEIEYMQRLSHQNIAPVSGRSFDGLDNLDSFDSYFLITERLDDTLGIQIKQWNVCESPPSMEQRTRYMEQLAQALSYLHNRRIVFRDLKPDNIGFRNNKIVLFDFGLCRELPNTDSEVFEMSGVGTQRYMANEVLSGEAYNCKIDVYSFALIAWEMISTVRPYLRYGNQQHREAVVIHQERPIIPMDCPKWIAEILRGSWCADVRLRHDMKTVVSLFRQHRRPNRQPRAKPTTNMFLRERTLSSLPNTNQQRNTLRVSSVHFNMIRAI